MSVASSQGRVRSPGPAWARYRVYEPGAAARSRPWLLGTGPDQKSSCPPCLPTPPSASRQAEGRQAGQGSASGHIEGGFPFPDIFRDGSWLHFWMLNGKSLRLGFRCRCLRCRMDASAVGFTLRMRQEDVGLTGQRRSLDGGSLAGGIWSLGF